jgi:hypothetical protein
VKRGASPPEAELSSFAPRIDHCGMDTQQF